MYVVNSANFYVDRSGRCKQQQAEARAWEYVVGHSKSWRAEQLITTLTRRTVHGTGRARDATPQAAAAGAREPRRARGGRARRKPRRRRVPAPVQIQTVELLHEELPEGQESIWKDCG